MDQTFDPDGFVRRIGERIVDEFKHAKAGTTPSTVGAAAEQPVRDQLEQVLPRGIAVGEGFVIDSYGGTSRQQDVVLYERDICWRLSLWARSFRHPVLRAMHQAHLYGFAMSGVKKKDFLRRRCRHRPVRYRIIERSNYA